MTETIRYLSLAIQTINLLQTELIRQFQKSSNSEIFSFKREFDRHLAKIKNIEMQKLIEKETISESLSELEVFLQKEMRSKNTSHSERYNYQSKFTPNETHRMRFTGFSFHQESKRPIKNEELNEIEEMIQSYKIKAQPIKCQTRMRWRSPANTNPENSEENLQKSDLMNNSSIEMLKQTIPEMEKRIKQLSFNFSSSKNSKELSRTLDSRGFQQRNYIPRLL